MTTILVFLLVLGVLVLVHEWGHFAAARWAGVRVETFSINFGPTIASIKRGDTLYKIGIIPLGGYVKMAGDEPNSDEADAPDAFFAKPVRKRAVIVMAGPVMNLVFAFAAAPLMYLAGIPEPAHWSAPATIGWVEGEAADGLLPGDTVTAISGSDVENWKELQNEIAIHHQDMIFHVRSNDGSHREVRLGTDDPAAFLSAIFPPMSSTIERVMGDSPAAESGLKKGDTIVAIDGTEIRHWMQIRRLLDAAAGAAVDVTIERNGSTENVQVAARKDESSGRYLLGIARQEMTVDRQYGFFESVQMGFSRVIDLIVLTFRIIGKLFSGEIGVNALGGPVMIAQASGEAAKNGFGALIGMMVFLSIQLGILNLLPIPVLDGGHMVLLGCEAALGRRVNDRVVEIAQWGGFLLLVSLMLFVTRNDIMRIWGDSIRGWFNGG